MKELRFLPSHEWFCTGCGKIGISDFAQKELGDIVFVELPEVGDKVVKGQAFANVESVKAVSEVYSPVSGTITEINGEIADNPALINSDAFSAWFIKVSDAEGFETLLSQAEYNAKNS